MKTLVTMLFLLCFFVNLYATDTSDYVTVSFNPSATPTRWAGTAQELYSQSSSSTSSSSDTWGGARTEKIVDQILLDDLNSNGVADTGDTVRDVYDVTEEGTRTTTTNTTTSTTSASAVNVVFTIWDIVDAGSTFSLTEDQFNQASNWSQKWNKNTSAQSTSSNSFQIRRDTETQVREDIAALNALYGSLFNVEERIESLVGQIEAYRSNPEQDKEHTALMSQLVKLRKEQFGLKKDIRQKRGEALSEQGTDLLGWTLSTSVSASTSTTTTDITQTYQRFHEHNMCFVASSLLPQGCSIEEAWKNNMVLSAGNLVQSGYYTGLVYMIYDVHGRALVPGAVTYNHLFLTTHLLQSKQAADIQKGDRLICGSDEIVTVGRIEVMNYQGYVYNISNDYEFFTFHPDYALTAGIAYIEGNRVEKQ